MGDQHAVVAGGREPARVRRAGASGRAVRARHVRRHQRGARRRRPRPARRAASSTCSTTVRCRTRCRRTCADGWSSSRPRSTATFNEFRGEIDGRARRRQRDPRRSCARATTAENAERHGKRRSRSAPRSPSDVRELARLRNRGRPGTSGTATTSPSRSPPRELDEDRLFATLDEVDDATRRAVRRRGRPSSTGRSPPASGAPSTSSGPGTTTTRSSRTPPVAAAVGPRRRGSTEADLEALTLRTYDGLGPRRPPRDRAQRPLRARRQEPARVLHRRRPRRATSASCATCAVRAAGPRRCSTSSATRSTTAASTATCPWLLRTHAPAHHRGRRDALRPAGARRRVAPAGRRRPGRRARRARAPTRRGAAAPRCSSFARWVLVMTHFERGLYADPDADHDSPVVGPRRAVPARAPPRRPARARLGGEDPPRGRARLLPELPVRGARRVAAASHARDRAGGIVDRPDAGRLLVDEFFAPGRVDALGPRWSSRRPASR